MIIKKIMSSNSCVVSCVFVDDIDYSVSVGMSQSIGHRWRDVLLELRQKIARRVVVTDHVYCTGFGVFGRADAQLFAVSPDHLREMN